MDFFALDIKRNRLLILQGAPIFITFYHSLPYATSDTHRPRTQLSKMSFLQILNQRGRIVGDDGIHASLDELLPVGGSIGGPGYHLELRFVSRLHLRGGDQLK